MKGKELKSTCSVMRIPMTTRLLALVTGMVFGLALVASAQTQVSGLILNGTWTATNSPYQVVGNIQVAGLTIQPGVQVVFQSNYVFEVDGQIMAQGTAANPIVFLGTNGGWQGIYFNYSSPGSVLANCIISNSINSGVRIFHSNPLLTNCVVANNSSPSNGGGINAVMDPNNLLVIAGCTITGNVANPAVGGGS
jgi:hypothetical protein